MAATVRSGRRLSLCQALKTRCPLFGRPIAARLCFPPRERSSVLNCRRHSRRFSQTGLAGEMGSWNSDGVILVAQAGEIYRINASGEGKPVKVLQMPGAWILSPQFLPDGKRFLFCVLLWSAEVRGTYIASLDEGAPKRLGPAENGAAWLPPDRVVFVRAGEPVGAASGP